MKTLSKSLLTESVDFSKISKSRADKIYKDTTKDLVRYQNLVKQNEDQLKEFGFEEFAGASKSYQASVDHLNSILNDYNKYMGSLNESLINRDDNSSKWHMQEYEFWKGQLSKRGSALDPRARKHNYTEMDEFMNDHYRMAQLLKKKNK